MSEAKLFESNPLPQQEVTTMHQDLYKQDLATKVAEPMPQVVAQPESATPVKKKKEKPTHYKVVCISLYTQDIENLEAKVAELKRRGHTKANKSQLIRQALRLLDIDQLPPPQQ